MTTQLLQAPPSTRPRAGDRALLDVLAVALPAALALALCLFELGSRSLWLDEAATVSIASQHGGAFGAALARDGGNMLAYYALLHVLIGAFGDGVLVLRLPSAIAAAVAVALTAKIALRLWGRRVAIGAGLLAADSLTLVYWGQQARGYTVMLALIAGSFLAFLCLLDSERPGWRSWLAYVALTTAAVYTILAAALVVPAQLLALLWRRPDRAGNEARRRWLALSAAGAVALGCVPLAVLAARRGSSQLFWVPAPSLRTATQIAQALASSGLQPGYYTAAGDALLILTGGVALAGAVEAWRRMRARFRPAATSLGEEWRPAIVVLWLVVPILADLVVSGAGHSIFQARYMLVTLPAVAILLAWTLQALRSRWLPGAGAVTLLVTLVALRATALAPSYGVSTERWRQATSYVLAHAHPGDCLAFYPLDTRMPFEYYGGASGRLPRSVLPALPWGEVRSYVEEYRTLPATTLAALPAACARLWLVWSHEGKLGGPPVSAENFRRLRSLRAALAARYRSSSTRTFGRASPITVQLFRAPA